MIDGKKLIQLTWQESSGDRYCW